MIVRYMESNSSSQSNVRILISILPSECCCFDPIFRILLDWSENRVKHLTLPDRALAERNFPRSSYRHLSSLKRQKSIDSQPAEGRIDPQLDPQPRAPQFLFLNLHRNFEVLFLNYNYQVRAMVLVRARTCIFILKINNITSTVYAKLETWTFAWTFGYRTCMHMYYHRCI